MTVDALIDAVADEVRRQDIKHGRFQGSPLGVSRLAVACLEDEVAEVRAAWRDERYANTWDETRGELIQVAAVALRAIRDAFPDDREPMVLGASNAIGDES